jgi:hypothetical protein
MSRKIQLVALIVFGLFSAAAPSFAEDPAALTPADPAAAPDAGSQEAPVVPFPGDQDPTGAIPASPLSGEAAPADPAPVAPPALKPITITFSGEVASVATSENPPMITIQDRYGVKKEIAVPSDAKVTAGTASKALADLKAGDKVTVEYTYDVATGKRTAQTINVGDAAPAGS